MNPSSEESTLENFFFKKLPKKADETNENEQTEPKKDAISDKNKNENDSPNLKQNPLIVAKEKECQEISLSTTAQGTSAA